VHIFFATANTTLKEAQLCGISYEKFHWAAS